jgi:group I intron endonuclease
VKDDEKQPQVVGPFSGKHHSEETRNVLSEKKSATWKITHPDEHTEIINNLRRFCNKHGLTYSAMLAVAAGRELSHKAFRCEKVLAASSDQTYYIYRITNKKNAKQYIGFTQDYKERQSAHWRLANAVEGDPEEARILYQAMRKHGWSNFEFEVIYCSKDGEHTLNVMEPRFIELYNTFYKTGHGYNMTLGGGGALGLHVSPETRRKMSESRKGEKNGFYNKTHDPQTRARMSKAAKERPPRKGEEAPNFGRQHKEESKLQISDTQAGEYFIIEPDNSEHFIRNLRRYCKEKGLAVGHMSNVSRGIGTQHKGYKCYRVVEGELIVPEIQKIPVRKKTDGTEKTRHRNRHSPEANAKRGESLRGYKHSESSKQKKSRKLGELWRLTNVKTGEVHIRRSLSAFAREINASVGNLHTAYKKGVVAYGYRVEKIGGRDGDEGWIESIRPAPESVREKLREANGRHWRATNVITKQVVEGRGMKSVADQIGGHPNTLWSAYKGVIELAYGEWKIERIEEGNETD